MWKLKWDIILHPKPRGLWRPLLEIKIDVEGENDLNINSYPKKTEILHLQKDGNFGTDSKCIEKKNDNDVKQALFNIYQEQYPNDNRDCYCCCIFRAIRLRSICFNNYRWQCFPEWRPGKADYTDVLEFFQEHVIVPIVEDFNLKTEVALKSLESPERRISGDNNNINFLNLKDEVQDKKNRRIIL